MAKIKDRLIAKSEIQQKDILKDRFLQKVDAAERTGLQPPPGDWEDMRQPLESMFDAFNAQQGAPADRPLAELAADV